MDGIELHRNGLECYRRADPFVVDLAVPTPGRAPVDHQRNCL